MQALKVARFDKLTVCTQYGLFLKAISWLKSENANESLYRMNSRRNEYIRNLLRNAMVENETSTWRNETIQCTRSARVYTHMHAT